MKPNITAAKLIAITLTTALMMTAAATGAVKEASGKPNIIFILADDLGEMKDLAANNTEKAKELRDIYNTMMNKAVPTGEAKEGAGQQKRNKRKTDK